MFIIPITQKPFAKKNLPSILKQQKSVWILVSIILPLLSIFTLYLFETYAGFTKNILSDLIVYVEIGYSVYLILSLLQEGIKINQSKLNKYKSNDMIYFTQVINKSQLNRYYIGFILYIVFIATLIFLN